MQVSLIHGVVSQPVHVLLPDTIWNDTRQAVQRVSNHQWFNGLVGVLRRVARQLGRFDCVVRRCWDQWIREMSFTRRPGSGCPRQTSRREDRYIVINARVQPTASSAAIQAQVAPSLGAPVSSRSIRRRLAEGHLGSWRSLRVLPKTPTHRRPCLEWCRARGN
ncbi:transposable element Tcb2 transposase [Trichonephila clavipes]|nr:transposable element Tcb2 transposase [Trichonephila clavipes]